MDTTNETPDIRSVEADLIVPPMISALPSLEKTDLSNDIKRKYNLPMIVSSYGYDVSRFPMESYENMNQIKSLFEDGQKANIPLAILVEIIRLYSFDIDFQRDIQKDNKTHVSKKTSEINNGLVKLIENYDTCRVLTHGAIVVLAGKTNSGKSTLFNALVEKNRSIVNETAGTTRDYVDANISISGVPIRLVDTAGVRRSKNTVEVEGIDNSIMLIEKADLVCLVRDSSVDDDLYVTDIIELRNDNIIYINNKSDLINEIDFNKKKDLQLYVSALNKTGISRLKGAILEQLNVEKIPNKLTGVSTPRQYECIADCIKSLATTNKMIKNGFQLELICYELENALSCINSLLGVETGDLVLNNMFNSFCVGK